MNALPPFPPARSARLLLREVEAADLPALLAVNGDDEVTRFLPYPSWRGADDAAAWFERIQTLVASGGTRQLVIVRLEDAHPIGTLLLFRHEPGSARLEVGYALGRASWRQGYAREALSLALREAFGPLGIRRVEAEVNPANIGSCALLGSLGFRHEGVLRQRWTAKGHSYDVNIYGLLQSEWSPPQAPLHIRADDLYGAEVAALLEEHLTDMRRISPPESVHALDIAALRAPHISFWSAWRGVELAGCAALRELDAAHGEIKSMRTAHARRGEGVGQALLTHILTEARRRGYARLSLETGSLPEFEPARRLYARNGFVPCAPFGEYFEDSNSLCMTRLDP